MNLKFLEKNSNFAAKQLNECFVSFLQYIANVFQENGSKKMALKFADILEIGCLWEHFRETKSMVDLVLYFQRLR